MRLPVGVCAWGACLHACMNAGLGITSQNTDRGTFRSRKENEPFLSMKSLPKACYTGLMVTDRILQSDMYLVHGHDRRSHERMVSSYAKSDRFVQVLITSGRARILLLILSPSLSLSIDKYKHPNGTIQDRTRVFSEKYLQVNQPVRVPGPRSRSQIKNSVSQNERDMERNCVLC